MREISAEELVTLALDRLAGGSPAELARILQRRDISDAADVSRPIPRWRDGKDEPRYRDTIRLLEVLGAIRWEALDDRPGSAGEPVTPPESKPPSPAAMRKRAERLEREAQSEAPARPRRGRTG